MNENQNKNKGGKRVGAGRPKGSNLFGEPTRPLRIPLSKINQVKAFIHPDSQHQATLSHCPLFSSKVQAGFPSPADDHIENHLDLNTHLIKHPAATFFVIASGDSMRDAGIQSGDLLIVDRALNPSHQSIVVAALNGELTVKRLIHRKNQALLQPAHPDYPTINLTEDLDVVIWGVVTHVIHSTEIKCSR